MSQRAEELAQQAGDNEREALFIAGVAVRESLFGNATEAGSEPHAQLQFLKIARWSMDLPSRWRSPGIERTLKLSLTI